jgi:uncharacterized protein (DUF3820 family)
MDDNSIMPFGKYKGQKLANIPGDYLLWLYKENKCFGQLKEYIEENKEVLNKEVKSFNSYK